MKNTIAFAISSFVASLAVSDLFPELMSTFSSHDYGQPTFSRLRSRIHPPSVAGFVKCVASVVCPTQSRNRGIKFRWVESDSAFPKAGLHAFSEGLESGNMQPR